MTSDPALVGLLTFAIAFPVIFLGVFATFVIRREWKNRPAARHSKEKH